MQIDFYWEEYFCSVDSFYKKVWSISEIKYCTKYGQHITCQLKHIQHPINCQQKLGYQLCTTLLWIENMLFLKVQPLMCSMWEPKDYIRVI